MDADGPTRLCKGQADRSANPSRRAGHKHRSSLVCLVHLIDLDCLVKLLHLVSFIQANKRDKLNKPINVFLSLMNYG
jgi:hypothetical protein